MKTQCSAEIQVLSRRFYKPVFLYLWQPLFLQHGIPCFEIGIIGSLAGSAGAFFTWHFLLTNCQYTKIHCKKYSKTHESLPCLPQQLFATVRIQQLISSRRTVSVLYTAPQATQPVKKRSLKKKNHSQITPIRMAGHSYLNICLDKMMSRTEKSQVRIRNCTGQRSRISYVRLLGIL